jgi:hypothetical protein
MKYLARAKVKLGTEKVNALKRALRTHHDECARNALKRNDYCA